jgi:hypothetical protein
MTMTRRRIQRSVRGAALVLALLCGLAGAAAADTDTERRTLAGLAGVHLDIAPVDATLERAGLGDAGLRAEIETRLGAAGITLLDVETARRTAGLPWLWLTTSAVKSANQNVYAWTTRLVLRQRVCLERSPQVCDSFTTWETSRFGSVGTRYLKNVREDVLALVDEFAAAWRAAHATR